jgi:predicted ATPase/class 3 adenylate cyclase
MQTQATLLHRLAPYLPTDRFRAELANRALPEVASGAAMLVDVSGFTPLTVKLVEEFGPQRAGEELKRRLNPMFEAIAGLVFTHGGSVIRFTGDGFTAWFDDTLPHVSSADLLPGLVRAAVAALEMMGTMVFFRGLDIKVAVSQGTVRRWVLGDPALGLLDVMAGNAVENVADLAGRCVSHEVRLPANHASFLAESAGLEWQILPDGDILLVQAANALMEQSRWHRWPAWQAEGDQDRILAKVKQFIDPIIQEQESQGLGRIASELRYATPVFLAFGGFDYEHDPAAYDKLDRYIRQIQRILHHSNGRLVSLEVGDKGSVIFSVFGAPLSYGDDSRRAVSAALEFRNLKREHPDLRYQKIGISRGLLYSGTVGGEVRHEYTSLGDETNVAARLMSNDQGGEILVSQSAYDDCHEWFEFVAGQEIMLKGRSGYAVRTYSPRRLKTRRQSNLRKLPLVGFEAELQIAQEALAQAGTGHPAVLLVEGEAGVGKSRFGAEICHLSESEGRLVAVGSCLSTGRALAFLPWRAILMQLLKLSEEGQIYAQIAQLRAFVRQNYPAWETQLPLLGEALGLPIEDNQVTRVLRDSARRQAVFSFILEILADFAQQAPLTLLIEDIQWLDEVSEALLVELLQRLQAYPQALCLVLTHRPFETANILVSLRETLKNLPFVQRLSLQELSLEAFQNLLSQSLGGQIPPLLRDFIYEKTLGNPLFGLEIAESLQAQNVIQRVGPRVYVDADLNTLHVPQTVQGLLLARLDRLGETEKAILKMASVIGRGFEMRVLYQSLPLDRTPQDVMNLLRALEREGFIRLEALYPEPRYTFKNAITQEVTYQTLPYDQRRDWHLAVGLVLEALYPDNVERLAHHFSQTVDIERAYTYLVKAGEKAALEFANHSALDYWGQAIDVARSQKEKFELLCRRLDLLMRISDMQAIENDFVALKTLAERLGNNKAAQLRLLRYAAEYNLLKGDLPEALRQAELGVVLADEYRDIQLSWELYSIQARLFALVEDQDRRRTTTYKLREIAIQLNEPTKSLRLILNDLLELASENPDAALNNLQTLQGQIEERGDVLLAANYWNIVSRITLQNRYLGSANEALSRQLACWRQVGNTRLIGTSLLELGLVHYMLGVYTEAGAYLRESYSQLRQVGDSLGEANSLVYLGAVAYRRGAHGEAKAYMERGLDSLRQVAPPLYQGRALSLLAQNAFVQGQSEVSRHYATEGLKVLENFPHLPEYLQVTLLYLQSADEETVFQTWQNLLENPLLALLQDPDIAFWQALQWGRRLGLTMGALRTRFVRFLREHMTHTQRREQRQAFLNLGYFPALCQTFDLDPLSFINLAVDNEQARTSTWVIAPVD